MNTGANFLSWLSAIAGPELAAAVQARFGGAVLMIPGAAPAPAPTLDQRAAQAAAGTERFITRRADRPLAAVCQVELEYGGVPFVLHCPAAEIAGVDRFEIAGLSLVRPGSLILFWNDATGQLRKGLAEPVGSPA